MVQLKKILKYLSSINTLLERERERERERDQQRLGVERLITFYPQERLEVGRNIISSLSPRGVLWQNFI